MVYKSRQFYYTYIQMVNMFRKKLVVVGKGIALTPTCLDFKNIGEKKTLDKNTKGDMQLYELLSVESVIKDTTH